VETGSLVGRQGKCAARVGAALLIVSALVIALAGPAPLSASVPRGLGIEDYFRLQRITDLTLSDDGQWLAYIVNRGSIHGFYAEKFSAREQQSLREVRLHALSESRQVAVPEALQDASALAWIPGTHELAFLSSRAGRPQVFSYDTATGTLRQRTRAADPVESFRFSPDGRLLAYLTREIVAPADSIYHQLFRGERGILADTDRLSVYQFVNPQEEQRVRPKPAVLWVEGGDEPPVRVPVPGVANAFFWSPDASMLSVTYVAGEVTPSSGAALTSVGIYEWRSGAFRSIAQAQPKVQAGIHYLGGEWVPGGRRILLRRVTNPDPWLRSFQDWAIADVTIGSLPAEDVWRPIEANAAIFSPLSNGQILVEDIDQGVRALFELTSVGMRPAKRLADIEGSRSQVRFSADFSTMAFVNESLTRPPEIYVRQDMNPVRPLTELNGEIARSVRYTAREVQWTSADGVRVYGWLLMPPSDRGRGPWPLVTHVHGGPGSPYMNAFAPSFQAWPYPFELMAERGIAVFLPNYRGTSTYGLTIASPARLDVEPVADIVSGIEHLVESGVADRARLGITGHSHGAWLAALVMARHRLFVAASFAEGDPNHVLAYLMMPGELNRRVHAPKTGSSLYDNWRPYVEASADLHFQGLRTASLWEGGAQSLAVLMMTGPKAARHAGAPTEFIIYPRTGHNPHLPSIQRESAERNLEWFAFWLQGEELNASEKAEQYARWRALRAQTWEDAKSAAAVGHDHAH
jgi:dipeptidyl aminopeptidase/acylaminoacyl peptidase